MYLFPKRDLDSRLGNWYSLSRAFSTACDAISLALGKLHRPDNRFALFIAPGSLHGLSLCKLGAKKWKSLQRWTYLAAALSAVHAVAYQQIESCISRFHWTLNAAFALFLTA